MAKLTKEEKEYIDFQMQIFEANAELDATILLLSVQKYINEHPEWTKKIIKETLESDLQDLTGIFSFYRNEMLRQMKDTSYNIDDNGYLTELQDEFGYNQNSLYTWQAVLINTCPSCLNLHGQSHTMKTWRNNIGLPRSGNTLCKTSCKCSLIPSVIAPTNKKMHNPIKIQSDRIRRAEEKRGKKYSDSYKTAMLGNAKNPRPEGAIRDLRKIKKVK